MDLISLLITILILALVFYLVYWVVSILPLPPVAKTIIYAILGLIAIVYLLGYVLPPSHVYNYHR